MRNSSEEKAKGSLEKEEENVLIRVIGHIDLLLKRIQHRMDFCFHLQQSLLFDEKLICSFIERSPSERSHSERCALNVAILPISLEMNTLFVLYKTVSLMKEQVKDTDLIYYGPFFDIIGKGLWLNHYYERTLKKVLKEGLVDENNLNYLNYLLNKIDY